MVSSTLRDLHASARSTEHDAGRWNRARWPLAAACVAASVAWLSADVLALSRELFVLPHAIAASLLTIAFVRREGSGLGSAAREISSRAIVVTLIAAGLVIGTVLAQPGAPRAQGAELAFQLVWEGVVYGAVDGVLLTVIPIAAIRGPRGSARSSTNLLALLASIAVFIVYHLGFPEFRGAALKGPIAASVIFGVTYLAARHPLAPILAHIAMHAAAVLHGPAGTAQLPPHT